MQRPVKKKIDPATQAARLAEIGKHNAERESGYRAKALKLYPHVCASCGREFEGARLKELTVHHKDHNHSNNPPDGSNWELLCLYCHDNEHEKYLMKGTKAAVEDRDVAPSIFSPFDGLDGLLK